MGPRGRERAKKETPLTPGEQNCLLHRCRSACSAPVSRLSLLELHLFVVESLPIQHCERGIVNAREEPVSDRPSSKTAPEGLASLFERRILRGGLSRCSIERACLGVHDESRLRPHAELRTHASAFFDDVHCKIRSGQSEFWR